ncbi:MAG: aldehyde dehydrogenase (NADP(+)) [Chitinophagaceae bacterium]
MKEIRQIIGYIDSAAGEETFHSGNPSRKEPNGSLIYRATRAEVNLAVEKSVAAFAVYRKKSGAEKAAFLEAIAMEMENSGDELIQTCVSETALPKARIEGERARTMNQLKMFALLIKEGSWVDARIETAIPDRSPLPKPDLRFMNIAIGPVVVFGASNFPLAFSVAGGDTASALAAGCTVIVKAHPAHPATSAIVGKAIQLAARKTGMPDGVFSLLFDNGIETGVQLVGHPSVKAVGFTGSFKGGKALFDLAVRRAEPIPVYAEMGSSNPVFILPGAAKEKGKLIADAYAASVTMGVGQFCTNPGILFYQQEQTEFTGSLKEAFEKTTGGVMLAPYIFNAYNVGLQERLAVIGVEELSAGNIVSNGEENLARPVLLSATADVFRDNPNLGEEIFGPSGIVVTTGAKDDLLDLARNLSGQLTATVHGTTEELPGYRELFDILEQKAGRVIINNFPTGVEVNSAMVHGGPFPATTDSRTTSVGTAAIFRFVRPVSYQNMPEALLPPELKDDNPMAISRMVNGIRKQDHE